MLRDLNHHTIPKIGWFQKIIHRFFKKFLDTLYHELAWMYDWVAAIVSIGRWNSWIETSINYLNGHRILELGHGTGHLIYKLIGSQRQIYGIDHSPQMTAIASAKLRRNKLHVNLSTAQSQMLPFATEVFDQIVATFPTEYILDENTLREIYRVLIPGGLAVILPAAYITGTNPVDRLASWVFNIAGQAPLFDDYIFEPARHIGFSITRINHPLDRSEVVIILAEKLKNIHKSEQIIRK